MAALMSQSAAVLNGSIWLIDKQQSRQSQNTGNDYLDEHIMNLNSGFDKDSLKICSYSI